MTESKGGTPMGDRVERWLNSGGGLNDREGLTPRYKSAEVVARVVLAAMEYARDEVTIMSNVPRLPQIMREQLRYPVQRWVFPANVVFEAAVMGINTGLLVDNPVPGVILGAYMSARRIIEKSIFQ